MLAAAFSLNTLSRNHCSTTTNTDALGRLGPDVTPSHGENRGSRGYFFRGACGPPATSFGSSGVTAEHVRNDLRAALSNITTGQRSRLYLLMSSGLAKVLAVLYDESGAGAFPGMGVNGGTIGGITVLVSDGVPSTSVVLVDAFQVAAGSETITLTSSQEASLQMDTTPDSPPIASTAYVNLWQNNWRALRAERYFGAVKLSTTGVCVITSVNWQGGSPA